MRREIIMKLPNNRAVRALSGVCAAGMLMASAMPVCAASGQDGLLSILVSRGLK